MKKIVLLAFILLLLLSTTLPVYSEQSTVKNLQADHLVINEVLYDTVIETNRPQHEWFEIYNPTDSSVNLYMYVIEDNHHRMQILAYLIMEPGMYVVVCNNVTAFREDYPWWSGWLIEEVNNAATETDDPRDYGNAIPVYYETYTYEDLYLNNDGDWLKLFKTDPGPYDLSGSAYLVDAVAWEKLPTHTFDPPTPTEVGVWNAEDVPDGYSIQRSPNAQDTDNCDSDFYMYPSENLRDLTTPGLPNTFWDRYVFQTIVDGITFHIVITSNSTVFDFIFNKEAMKITFNVTGPWSTYSFCNITIPNNLLWGDFNVLVDANPPFELIRKDNATHISLYFTYTHGFHEVLIQGSDTAPPIISILSPENKTYPLNEVPLTFTVDEPTDWMGYSLDGQTNVTIAGNTTLTSLFDGLHYVVVYANDSAGNMGSSSMVYFTADTAPPNITDVSQNPLGNNVLPEDEVKVNATVIDGLSRVKQVTLNYTNGNGTWVTVDMTNLEGNIWNATIPAFPYCTNVTYMVIAEDNVGNTITTEEIGYEYQYHVIPEFPTWTLILLILMVLTVAIAIYKRRLLKTPIHQPSSSLFFLNRQRDLYASTKFLAELTENESARA